MIFVLTFCLFLVPLTNAIEIDDPSRWLWSWTCVNENCLRTSTFNEKNETTLNSCKILCNKYRSLWPMPTGPSTFGNNLVLFNPHSMNFDYSKVKGGLVTRETLQKMVEIFQNKMFKSCGTQCGPVPDTEIQISFQVSLPDVYLNWETDEGYALNLSTKDSNGNVTTVDINIKSNSIYGARHALETISQLTVKHTSQGEYQGNPVLAIISAAQITDSPAYPHRGLVLDTARHYISIPAILKTLDAMAMTKLNVLHWHVTDSQSFPLEIPRVPQMLRYGAYSADRVYRMEDAKLIIESARLRGIRVIIEIDGPAHAGNGWQWGEKSNLGKLALCVNQQPWRKYCIQPPCGQLNPVNPNVPVLLKKIYADIIDILPPGEVFHMGGDEVFFPCWNSSSEVLQWMDEHNYRRDEKDFLNLWGIYQQAAYQAFQESNKVPNVSVILWSSSLTEPESIEKYLDKNRYVIETWMEDFNPIPKKLLDKGYRLIMSPKNKWYLDHGFWGKTTYHSWKKAYDTRLPNHPKVLGGEGAMWSERVDDHSLDVKIWPRAAAIGERLWANPHTKAQEAEVRFENFRERLTAYGINADVTSPYYCYQNDKKCD